MTRSARAAAARFAGLEGIDWGAPWFAALAPRGRRWQQVALECPDAYLAELTRDATDAGHRTGCGAPLHFIAQAQLPPGAAYETHIAATGGVPTRENLHDFFNALTWFAYPRIKAALNARQAGAIARDGVGGARGAERDALTLFDENAVLFVSTDRALREALVAFDWRRLFVGSRAAWGGACTVQPFGHALLEKLMAPYKACTAHAWLVEAPEDFFGRPPAAQREWLDKSVSEALLARPITSRLFAPLPVLGIPGWWPANSDASFYDDERVFRRARLRAAGSDGGPDSPAPAPRGHDAR